MNFEVFNGKLRFYWNGEPVPYLLGSKDLRDNQWHFISFVRDKENKKIYGYIDGVLDFEHSGEVSDKQAVIAHRIGRDSRQGDTHFEGQIADLRVWKIARTAEDIKNSMYLQLKGKEVGLVGYWRLGAIGEGQVVDFSINGQNGTVYGDAYVSAATLNRKLASGLGAVKYSNDDLFAVSERATYEESFEFKVVSSSAVNLAYLNNADSKNLGTKLFKLSYWGKASRSAEAKQIIAPEQIKQNKFEDLGGGWYRVSGNVTIPDGISMLRSFEIANVEGNWQSLEIRKHRIRLMSESITEFKYSDGLNLTTLADNQATLVAKMNQLQSKEQQETLLLKEKQDLQDKLAKLNNLNATIAQKDALSLEVTKLRQQKNDQQITYDKEKSNPANYRAWYLENKASGLAITHWVDALSSSPFPSSMFGNTLVFLSRSNRGDFQWTFVDQGDGWFIVKIVANDGGLKTSFATPYMCRNGENAQGEHSGSLMDDEYLRQYPDRHKFKLIDTGDGYYYIQIKETGRILSQGGGSVYKDEVRFPRVRLNNDYEKFRLTKVEENSLNGKVENLLKSLNDLQATIKLKEQELANLIEIINEGTKNKSLWENRLKEVIAQLTTLQTAINTLNTEFLNGVKSTQQTPQTMPQIAKDRKGLVTQGAVLGFVNSVTRLNAMETSEGNVQLSYFDNQGRMRQTNYDATADSKNATFEQWIPDAQRTCLNFNNRNSVVKLNQPLYLPKDWSIEAWFVYPLPEAGEWNTLTRGKDAYHHILVRNRKQLGIYLNNDPLGQNFYDSGFNMGLLSEGWHHLTVIGKGDTTLFYIDGKKVGDTKAKALADAEENLKKAPNDATAKQKLENIKKATVKVASDVYAIGNYQGGTQPFGKVAEVRIWGVALTNDEIAVNAKTLLSGNEPGLLAYYPFNEATGTVVRDQSGQGNGTVSGAIWWGCTAPIGNPGNTVMKFNGVNDYIAVGDNPNLRITSYTLELWIKPNGTPNEEWKGIIGKPGRSFNVWLNRNGFIHHRFHTSASTNAGTPDTPAGSIKWSEWNHVVITNDGTTARTYLNGKLSTEVAIGGSLIVDQTPLYIGCGLDNGWGNYFKGQMAEVRIWKVARTQAEIQGDMYQRLSGKEANLVAYYPLNEIRTEGSVQKVLDLAGNNHGTVIEAITVDDQTLPIAPNSLLCNEYGSVSLESNTKRKVAMMRRFFAHPSPNGVTLLPDKRVEALELKWIGNAQFAPTLLGYIEGPPPVPSENLTLEDDYNGATSVELTMSEHVEFNWTRSQDSGLGGTLDTFIGAGGAMSILTAPMGVGSSIETTAKVGFKGNFDFNYQFQNESSIK